MNKASFAAVFWTLVLAVPFTLAALISIAYLTEHTGEIASFFQTFNQQTAIGEQWRLTEVAKRLPELAGMLIGQLVILTIFLFSRKIKQEPG